MSRPKTQDQIFQRLNELQARAQAQEQSYQQQLDTSNTENDQYYDETHEDESVNIPPATQKQPSDTRPAFQQSKNNQQTISTSQEDDFDLLGGLPDEEDFRSPRHDQPATNQYTEPSNDAESVSDSVDMWDLFGEEEYVHTQQPVAHSSKQTSEPSKKKNHRELPQRGRLDTRADEELDRVHTAVPFRKFGKNDGTYMFGTRVIKFAIDPTQGLIVVAGTKKQAVTAFVRQFEKVEALKLKGLGVKDMFSALTSFGLI